MFNMTDALGAMVLGLVELRTGNFQDLCSIMGIFSNGENLEGTWYRGRVREIGKKVF
jgi:hypothetical protein